MKLKFNFALCLIALLAGCGGPKECDDSAVLNQIKENVLQTLQSHKLEWWSGRVGAEAAEAGLAKVKEEVTDVKITDVFNFRKYKNGTRTCKAKLTMQSVNGKRSIETQYKVINYEDGYQVETDESGNTLVVTVVNDYLSQAQAEAGEIRRVEAEAKAAALQDFLAKAPQGNVCADHFDQTVFIRDHVDMDLGDWVYEYDEAFSKTIKDIVASSTVRITDIQTYGEVEPSDRKNLDTSKYFYRCKGKLELTLPDGTVDANDEFYGIYFYAYAESQGNQLVSYRPEGEGGKFDLTRNAGRIARKLKYDY